MRLSIAMTTYNGERFVEEQLLSLLRQTRPADEVVIVDDGSRDRTAERVEGFIARNGLKARGWTFERNEINVGFKENFYRAVEKTRGERIALCDQDDKWRAEKLERMERVFEENPGVRSLGCAFDAIGAEGERLPSRGNILPDAFFQERGTVGKLPAFQIEPLMLLGSNRMLGCTMMIDRRTADAYLRHSKGEIAHDWEMNLIAAIEDGWYFLNEQLIEYRLHDANTIGLRGSPAGKPKVDVEGRKAVHGGFEGALRFCEGYKPNALQGAFKARLEGYARARRELLEARSWKALPSLWMRYGDIYRKLFPFKQRMGDVLAMMQK